ncbi:MAG: mechanosensitive ion channel family protein [Deltaproteobacteria bacterium]|nr:mechanosensitive ion channel family protein [Deltaproteobacteria bacterium]
MFGFSLDKVLPVLSKTAVDFAHSLFGIALICVAGYIGVRFLRLALERLELFLIRHGEASEQVAGSTRKRVSTLTSVLRTIGVGLIWSVVVVVALAQLGINIAPVLAGAGILGLAVGFGAQNLVRDVIGGFFLILENQIRVGDVAIINGTGGLVEAITFRTVVLRDLSAAVHVFPNGAIQTLSNLTKGWSAYVLDVGVAYKEDTDQVTEVMRRVDQELRQDPEFGARILEPIEIFGVDAFADSAVVIKARIKTQPIKQWNVGREYRRRLKKAFDAAGIELPFPHRTLCMGEASRPFDVLLKDAASASSTPEGARPAD